MRVSREEGDPGYMQYPQKYVVYLDGVQVFRCVMADTELGEIKQITEATEFLKTGVMYKTLKGKVTIE